jgi:hypothetical protein
MDQNKKPSPRIVFATTMGGLAFMPFLNIIHFGPVANDIFSGLGLILLGWMTFYVIRKRVISRRLKVKAAQSNY